MLKGGRARIATATRIDIGVAIPAAAIDPRRRLPPEQDHQVATPALAVRDLVRKLVEQQKIEGHQDGRHRGRPDRRRAQVPS